MELSLEFEPKAHPTTTKDTLHYHIHDTLKSYQRHCLMTNPLMILPSNSSYSLLLIHENALDPFMCNGRLMSKPMLFSSTITLVPHEPNSLFCKE